MKSFQQKRKGWNKILHSSPVLGILGVLVLVFAWGVVGFLGKMQIARANRLDAERKVAELAKEKEKLSSDIAKLKTNDGIEETIREKFGLAKQGEGEIVIIDDKKTDSPAMAASTGGFWSYVFFWRK